MKTYEELYNKYRAKPAVGQVVNYDSFIEALTEHDKEIVDKIENKIEEIRKLKTDTPKDSIMYKEKMMMGTYGILLLKELLKIFKEK